MLCVWSVSEPSHNLSGIHPDELNALESVQEITDFLQIQANFSGFHNLSFLRNLQVIHGRVLDRYVTLTTFYASSDEHLSWSVLVTQLNTCYCVQTDEKRVRAKSKF